MQDTLLVVVVVLALAFAWMNGFHDASNAVATSLSSATLTARVALPLAGALNVVGALLGVGVAQTIGTRLVDVPVSSPGLGLVAAALVAAFGWNVVTWSLGLPSSSSHALIGGLTGGALAAGGAVQWGVVRDLVLVPMVLSPVVGFALAWLLMAAIIRSVREVTYGTARRRFKIAQTVSASAVALGHGLQDGQKTMGVIVIALAAGGHAVDGVPLWVRVAAAVALGAGTVVGGGRIIRTLGRRVVPVDPVSGFAAESVSAVVLAGTAVFQAPVSSTHTVTASIMGAGSTRGRREIRWAVVRRILLAWVLTPFATALGAAVLYTAGGLVA
ncbi:inorganic phosphate transporter [Kineosporia sp. R_H_3]|uniref:inorganic phosphate transporter n=1 Tax=Kineosporia sp. R_H_3 TaxID=1961848 RepID=UPI000B4AEE19|nr:inorganic phosphate transporter [Kineosporia sp. R_H_3]